MLLLGVVQAQAAGDVSFGSYDLLATEILTSAQASVTFSSLGTYASDYQHLQIRMTHRDSSASPADGFVQLNGDTATNYSWHYLLGTGSSVVSGAGANASSMFVMQNANTAYSADIFAATVSDLLDPFETTKNKTIRTLTGVTGGTSRINLHSGNWRNTDSVTSIRIFGQANFVAGSRFSLYGLRK